MVDEGFIAIVDDDIDITNLFYDALSAIQGIQIFKFTNPLIALDHFKINQHSYALVISDLKMPEMNGLEFLSAIKSLKPSIRTILMTAFQVDDNIFEVYKKEGIINLVLQKPIRVQELIRKVNSNLPNRIPTTK